MRLVGTLVGITFIGACGVPAAALADVEVFVPKRFFGDRGASSGGPDIGRTGRIPAPQPFDDDCEGFSADECVILTDDQRRLDAPYPDPGAGPVPEVPEAPADTVVDPIAEEPVGMQANALPTRPRRATLLVFPRRGDWLTAARPSLRWRASPRATYYNVQVAKGGRRVLTGWTKRPSLRVPLDALRQGEVYTWTVWAGMGPRSAARFTAPLGQSSFRAPIRVHISFREVKRGRSVQATVRPPLPGATLRLVAPRAISGRVPRRVTIDEASGFRLKVSRASAERLRAWLVDRGPRPPRGLRG